VFEFFPDKKKVYKAGSPKKGTDRIAGGPKKNWGIQLLLGPEKNGLYFQDGIPEGAKLASRNKELSNSGGKKPKTLEKTRKSRINSSV